MTDRLLYNKSKQTTVLDYEIDIQPLKPKDTYFVWQDIGNYSLTGFEVHLARNSGKYLINYYLNSGLFVIVSWVRMAIFQLMPSSLTKKPKFLGKLFDPT